MPPTRGSYLEESDAGPPETELPRGTLGYVQYRKIARASAKGDEAGILTDKHVARHGKLLLLI